MCRFAKLILVVALLTCACGGKEQPPPITTVYEGEEIIEEVGVVEVPFRVEGGVRIVEVLVNGVKMDMVFDTGASGVSISMLEVMYLAKQGLISEDDILGEAKMRVANGSIEEGMVINIKELKIGDTYTVNNVMAVVSSHIDAPLLLGNSAIQDRFEVDDVEKVIRFYLY